MAYVPTPIDLEPPGDLMPDGCAKLNGNLTDIQSELESVGGDAATAQGTADTAVANAATAQGTADGAVQLNDMGGKISRTSDTELRWITHTSAQNTLFCSVAGVWRSLVLAAEPTLASDANDMGGDALTYDLNYDVFLKYVDTTSATLHVAKHATATARCSTWLTATEYAVGQRVSESGSYYACVVSHTSGTFADDLTAGRWILTSGTGDDVGLGILDGVPVYAASAAWREYRYVGKIRLRNDTGAKFTDSYSQRWIANRYNADPLTMGVLNPYSSVEIETAIGQSFGSWGANGDTWKCSCVLDRATPIALQEGAVLAANDLAVVTVAIGMDSKNPAEGCVYGWSYGISASLVQSRFESVVAAGYHEFWPLRASMEATAELYWWYDGGNGAACKAGFRGRIG